MSSVPPNLPPSDPLNWTGCVHHFAPMAPSLQGSWSERLYRPSESGLIFVPDVPVGVEHVVRFWGLALCSVNAQQDPVTSRTLFANGVELTRLVTHPSGMTGAAFQVTRQGVVSP